MTLTPEQRRFLQRMAANRENPPTVGRLFWSARPWLFVLVALTAMCLVGYFLVDDPTVPAFGLGAVAGMMLRAVRQIRTAQDLWPTIADITDWDRVTKLLAADDGHLIDNP
ncbi:MAG TPA: hypothetical protein VKE40_27440 [Gemmataceae bacterium]|nr:hypothetical protein [Gemmataceae bacterium]